MWIIDSNSEGCMEDNHGWGCIEPDQISWYQEKSADVIKKHGKTKDLAFYHIPVPEVMDMTNKN